MVNYDKIMYFEKRQASGLKNLEGIIHAIKNSKIISFQYTKPWEGVHRKRVVEPYVLKKFRNRWYLIANERDDKDFFIKTFGMDRIYDLDISNSSFRKKPVNIDAKFENSFGIISSLNKALKRITLNFNLGKKRM